MLYFWRFGLALNSNIGKITQLVTSVGPGLDGTITTLANAMCERMTDTNCLYLFSSSWTNHVNGYMGYGFYVYRNDQNFYYAHVIDGNAKVWDIYKNGSNVFIKEFT